MHLSHPQATLNDQFIKLTNGIIYQFHPIISQSFLTALCKLAQNRRMVQET